MYEVLGKIFLTFLIIVGIIVVFILSIIIKTYLEVLFEYLPEKVVDVLGWVFFISLFIGICVIIYSVL